ncbi:unnamed protein product [Chrysodeixis includens]|uniref:Uncharacterized protein n=1 Tax=Chrysodeixis includens TaxID=689277 RepID=A0A9N8PYR1_CHRIL|nr:unnamed protein product [Chrysodeixis includens]
MAAVRLLCTSSSWFQRCSCWSAVAARFARPSQATFHLSASSLVLCSTLSPLAASAPEQSSRARSRTTSKSGCWFSRSFLAWFSFSRCSLSASTDVTGSSSMLFLSKIALILSTSWQKSFQISRSCSN